MGVGVEGFAKEAVVDEGDEYFLDSVVVFVKVLPCVFCDAEWKLAYHGRPHLISMLKITNNYNLLLLVHKDAYPLVPSLLVQFPDPLVILKIVEQVE